MLLEIKKENKIYKLKIDVLAMLFSKDENKQECFKKFTLENKLNWCKENLSLSQLEQIKEI